MDGWIDFRVSCKNEHQFEVVVSDKGELQIRIYGDMSTRRSFYPRLKP